MAAQTVDSPSMEPSRQVQAAMVVVMETHQRLVNILVALVVADILFIGGLLAWSAIQETSPETMVGEMEVADSGALRLSAGVEVAAPSDVPQEEPVGKAKKAKKEGGEGAATLSETPTIASELLNPIEDAFLSEHQRKLLNERGIK